MIWIFHRYVNDDHLSFKLSSLLTRWSEFNELSSQHEFLWIFVEKLILTNRFTAWAGLKVCTKSARMPHLIEFSEVENFRTVIRLHCVHRDKIAMRHYFSFIPSNLIAILAVFSLSRFFFAFFKQHKIYKFIEVMKSVLP